MTSFDDILEMKEKRDIDSLISNIKNEDVAIRVSVAQAIGYLGDIRATEPLIESLRDENEDVRKESAMSLSIIGDKLAVDPLIEALNDESANVRERAAFGLGELGDKKASESLVKLLNDENIRVREIAFFSLESLKNETDYNVKEILDNYKSKLGLNIQSLDLFRTPTDLIDFIGRFVSYWQPKRILDPASCSGSLVYGINSNLDHKPIFEVFGFNREFFSLENEKNEPINLKMHFHDFFSSETELISNFDLIVSDIVLYNLLQNPNFKSNDFKIAILTKSLELLNKEGILIFIVPHHFLYSKDYRSIREFLMKFYSVEAVISIPNSYSYPYSGIKTSMLIIKNSNKQNNDIFLAEYKQKHSKEIITNFQSKNTNKNVSQGFFVNSNVLKTNIWTFDHLSSLEEFKHEVKSKDLIKLSQVVEVLDKSENNENLILIPKRWDTDNVLIYSEFSDDKNFDNYLLCKVLDEKIMPQYVKLYLNSDEGKKNRNPANTDNWDENVLNNIYINTPPLEIQEKIFEADQIIRDLQNKIGAMFSSFQNKLSNYSKILELNNKLDETDKKELLYTNFIWPLATSHYIATKGSPNVNSQLDNCFKLFELIAAFNSIILLSAMPKEIYIENRSTIYPSKFRTVGFGDWVALYRRLSSIFNENEGNALFFDSVPFDNDFYKNLTGKKIFKILDEVTNYRNKTTGHGGVIPEIIAKDIVINTTPGLNEIFKRMNFFNDLELIHTISFKKNNGLYNIKLRMLKGTQVHFPIKQIDTKEDMDTEVLYLYDPNSGDRLKLLPELINLYECPICGRWALYLYSKIKGKNAVYKSYQSEPHNKELNNKDVKEFLGI